MNKELIDKMAISLGAAAKQTEVDVGGYHPMVENLRFGSVHSLTYVLKKAQLDNNADALAGAIIFAQVAGAALEATLAQCDQLGMPDGTTLDIATTFNVFLGEAIADLYNKVTS